jgi:selenium metabolism protein YedF
MVERIDCRGLQCPQPVIQTKKALESIKSGTVVTIVDNETAKENVVKLAKNMNYAYNLSATNDGFAIEIVKEEAGKKEEPGEFTIAVLLSSDTIGRGSEELGKILAKSFIYSMTETEPLPKYLILMNSGVKIAVDGSPLLEELGRLQEKGVKILACGTCLDYFKMKESLAIGEISNMYTITEIIYSADKTIAL